MSKWVTAQVITIKKRTNNLFSIILHAPISSFTAGQFAKLSFKNKENIQRAYSYVNAPNNPNLEFYIVLIPNGKMTNSLYNLMPNDELLITQEASGFFTLDEIPNCKNLWMLATGTGIGPYLSILQDQGNIFKKFKNVILVHAVRYANELNYTSLINQLEKKYYGKFYFQTIVSREIKKNSLTGRIPELLKNKNIEEKIGLKLNANSSHVMLCGNPNMIKETQKLLSDTRNMHKNLRRKPGHITSENYW